jgi:hypothetical protein
MMEIAVYGLPARMPHWSFGVRYTSINYSNPPRHGPFADFRSDVPWWSLSRVPGQWQHLARECAGRASDEREALQVQSAKNIANLSCGYHKPAVRSRTYSRTLLGHTELGLCQQSFALSSAAARSDFKRLPPDESGSAMSPSPTQKGASKTRSGRQLRAGGRPTSSQRARAA